MYALYNILLHLTVVVASPFLLLMVLFNRYNLRQRLGSFKSGSEALGGRGVWFHAASMGEVAALATVVDEIKRWCPLVRVAVSTTSATGQRRAKELIPSAEGLFLAPLDLPWAVDRVLRRLQPTSLLLTETELWPNMIVRAKHRGCKVALINGRMSPKSVDRYRRVKGLMSALLDRFDLLCVQTETDRDRFLALGADPERVAVLGNLKFDLLRFLASQTKSTVTRESLGIPSRSKVIVAGSTRPGEEEILLPGYTKVREAQGETVFIMAPRHLDRIGEVERILSNRGMEFTSRSRTDNTVSIDSGIILLDTMGELTQVYSFADVAFVGGSLVPCGGHNPLEPAMWGVPVLFGPHRDHVRQLTDLLIQQQGGIEIKNGDDFADTVIRLLKDPDERERRGRSALKVVEDHSGVATRTVQVLRHHGVL